MKQTVAQPGLPILKRFYTSLGKSPPLVNFAIAGAQKSGTTALFNVLRVQSEIFMVPKSHRGFFAYEPRAFLPGARRVYEEKFQAVAGEKSVGESASSYLFYPHALRAMKRYNPDMKFIVMLRNPVDRAFSHWNMNVTKGRETRSFEEAVKAELATRLRLKSRHYYSYLERGLYAKQSSVLLDLFPRDNCLFLRSDELLGQTAQALGKCSEFLGVQPCVPPDRTIWNKRNYDAQLCPDIRTRLTDYFADDTAALGKLISVNCSDWLNQNQLAEIAAGVEV